MKKIGKLRLFLVLALILVAIGTTVGTLVYWTSTVNNPSDASHSLSVSVGTGEVCNTAINLTDGVRNPTGKKIVPVGQIADSNTQTDTVTFTVKVKWVAQGSNLADADGITGILTPSTSATGKVKVGVEDVSNLFEITFDESTYSITCNNSTDTTVTVTVKMINAPADKAIYDKVAGKDAVVNLTFAVVKNAV